MLLKLDACLPVLDHLNAKLQSAEDLARLLHHDECVEVSCKRAHS